MPRPAARFALLLAAALWTAACSPNGARDSEPSMPPPAESVAASPPKAESEPAPEAPKAPPAQALPAASGKDAALVEVDVFCETLELNTSDRRWRLGLPLPPKLTFEEGNEYFWVLETNHGPIRVQLMPEVAPMHVSSTIFLTRLGFYDGLTFHRVIPEFMAQGGCPLGSGTGGPGYKYGSEIDPNVTHDRGGLLSMANGGPGTDGSQFFLTFAATPWLDGKHTIFGEVVQGMDTLKTIEALGSQNGTVTSPVVIRDASIEIRSDNAP